MTLDLGMTAALLGAAITLIGAFVSVIRWLVRVNRRFETLERHDKDDGEARELMLGGLYAALDGLRQLGANGNVTNAEERLKTYMFKR